MDSEDLVVLARHFPMEVQRARSPEIPVRETRAYLGAELPRAGVTFQEIEPDLGSATDVLRLIAALSGHSPALQGAPDPTVSPSNRVICRFRVAPLKRSLRRALLARLDALPLRQAIEDMLRHRSHWIWVAEFLHLGEYAARFPNAARAFAILRSKSVDPATGKRFVTWMSDVKAALDDGNFKAFVDRLVERPGELARRLDLSLSRGAARRLADAEPQTQPARRRVLSQGACDARNSRARRANSAACGRR